MPQISSVDAPGGVRIHAAGAACGGETVIGSVLVLRELVVEGARGYHSPLD
jgi:hypothetical protein